MKQSLSSRSPNEQVVATACSLNAIKRHQPRAISSGQYLDSCGHSSSSSSTSSCCSSTSNSTSGFASASSILSDHPQAASQAASISPGATNKAAVLPSRQQQRRRSWLLASLGTTNTTTTTTSCGPLTTSQEDDEEEEGEEGGETPRSTPFSLASSTPTQQQSPNSFLLGAAHSGTILEEEAGAMSAPRSPQSRGAGAISAGETSWLLAGDSPPSSDDDDDEEDLLGASDTSSASTTSRSSSSSSSPSSSSSRQRPSKSIDLRTKRTGRRARFWRLVASSTSGSSSSTTSGSGEDNDGDQDNCDTKPSCDQVDEDEDEAGRRGTFSCPVQDLFEYSQESNPNNQPRLVLPSPHLLGNQLWHQHNHHARGNQHEFAPDSPQLPGAAGCHHPTLARLNSIHEDHDTEVDRPATNDFKVAASSSSSRTADKDAALIRERTSSNDDDDDDDDDDNEEHEAKEEEDEEAYAEDASVLSSNAEEEVELGQVNREGAHSDDGDDAQDDDQDDDDYFYDEELSFSHQRRFVGGVCSGRAPLPGARATFQRPSIPAAECPAAAAERADLAVATPTGANELIMRLSAASGARPLLVWAPTARRTSCPVGQLTSLASWRQLWPTLPQPPSAPPAASSQPHQPVLCPNCTNQQATATNSPIQWSDSCQPQPPPGLATVKSSRTSLACSDYFSSFDQPDQAQLQPPPPSHPPCQSSSLRRRLGGGGCGGANPMQTGGSHGNALAELPPLELRRQSTITGFDHHRYTAPRSPSLCLPHVVHHPVQARAGHLLTAANAGAPSTSGLGLPQPSGTMAGSGRLLLSPTHSTGGSSSPSPTGWHHQNAAALAAVAIAQQQQHQQQQVIHAMHQRTNQHQQQPPAATGRNQFGRNRLESLESDRGSSPSWSASTSSLRSSIGGGGGGGNSIYSALAIHQQQRKRSSGSIGSTASSSGVHSLASTASGGGGCPACQQLQVTASKCPARGHLAQGKQPPAPLCPACAQQQPQCGAQILRQLREEALEGAKLGPLAPSLHPSAVAFRPPFGQPASGSQQVGPAANRLLHAVDGQQQVDPASSAAQRQEQAVYFFLCCCQRNGSKNDGESVSPPTTSQADEHRPVGSQQQQQQQAPQQRPGQQQQGLRPLVQEPERRVSLVARPAIVGAPDGPPTSPVAGTSGLGQQARRSTAGLACQEGSKSLTSRDSAPAKQQQQQQQQHEPPQGMAEREPVGANNEQGARQQDEQKAKEEQEQEESRQIPKGADGEPDLRGQLSALLNQLDGYQRQGRQLGADERELLSALSLRMSSVIGSGAAIAIGAGACRASSPREHAPDGPPASSSPAQAQAQAQAASTDRANMMRYSTPNLLLTSNFELLLRQQDRRKQEQSDQVTAEQEGPPEATEAWFLSRSPTSGQATGASAAAAAPAGRNQRGSRESIRLRALESIATAASGKVAAAPQLQPAAQPGATLAQQQQSDTWSGLPDGPRGPEAAGPEVNARPTGATATETASWQTRQVLDQQLRGEQSAAGSCQSASDGICKEQTFDERPPPPPPAVRAERGAPIHDELQRRGAPEAPAGDHDANPIRRRQRDANREQAPGGGSDRSDAPVADGQGQQQHQRAAPGEQVAEAGRAPASPVAFVVHDKSMAQARYLYSTLTSNAGALLATGSGAGTGAQAASSSAGQAKPAPASATATTNQQQPQSTQAANKSSASKSLAVSPTRSTGPQRKQAQFVAQQRERQLRELQQQRQQQQPPQSTRADAGRDSKLIGPLPPQSSRAGATSARERAPRKTRTRRQGGSGGDDDDEGSSGSESDRGDGGPAHSPGPPANEPQDDDDDEAAEAPANEPAPAIVESVCEQRRRSSQSSTAGGSAQEQQHQQQLQPMSMDPEMHALWAQGADLDTGNGNFIQATRRRRSVHAIHQVQLHQALQQQHQQVVGGGGGGGTTAGSKLGLAGHLAHERRSQQLTAADLPCAGTSAGVGSRLTPAAVDSSRKLKDKLRKLRSSSSIEETQYRAAARSQQLSGTARARFVSDPSTGGGGGAQLSSGRSGELHAAPSSVQMDEAQAIEFDDELEAAVAAAAAAADELNLEAAGEGLKPSFAEEEEDEEIEKDEDLGDRQMGLGDEEREEEERADTEDERRVCLSDGTLEYDLDELESNESMLANLFQWNYPIFDMAQQYGQSILSKLSYRIFYDSGFFESFKIPKRAFFNFFHALEEGYLDKPYHNRLHAADVLHAVYYLTSQPIGNFCQVPLDLIELYDNLLATTKPSSRRLAQFELSRRTTGDVAEFSGDQAKQAADNQREEEEDDDDEEGRGDEFVSNLHNHIVAIVVAAAAAAADSELPFGIMGANLTALEVMALYTAAAMHDFQHPGRTNSFLVATSSPLVSFRRYATWSYELYDEPSLALLYNDRSVLENHHSAAAWALFYSGPEHDWLCNLEKDEFKRFRFMIIELILATDLMRHYELVSAFNKKLHNVGRHNIDWFCESDRLLVMEIIIKLADVNGPMKGHHLHCQWTDRIAMEFYEQGDEERARNLPVSLYMDRSDPRLPELQKSFINHLVGPLSHSYAAAGFFPKSSEPEMLASAGAIARAAAAASGDEEEEDDRRTETRGHSEEEPPVPQSESVYNQTKYWLIDNSREGRKKLNKQFLECVQTTNLRDNFLYWDAKSREKQLQQNSRKLS